MNRQVVAELSILPVGTGSSGLSRYIAACLEILEKRQDISYRLTAMGTIVQGPLEQILEITRQMHEVPFNMGVSRVVTTLKIDDRRDKPTTIDSKVKAVVELRPLIKT